MKKVHTTPIDEKKVRYYADLRDWTLSGLSIQMGMPVTFLSNRLREGTLSAEALTKLAALLGCDREEIMSEKQDRKPTIEDVRTYFADNGCTQEDADAFFSYQTEKGWITSVGNPILSWRGSASKWISKPTVIETENSKVEALERRISKLEKELKELETACQKAVWRLLAQ